MTYKTLEETFVHTLCPSGIITGSFSRGNAGRDGDLWGGTGASGGGLTWPAARGGSVQGFPSGQYGPGVLDEHTGGTGKGGGESHCREGVRPKAEASSQPVARSGAGGDRNRRRGARFAPRYL